MNKIILIVYLLSYFLISKYSISENIIFVIDVLA